MAHADAIGVAMAADIPETIIPASLNDRDADNWRPPLAIAALAGGNWLTRGQRAASALCVESADSDRRNEWALGQIAEFVDERRGDVIAQWRAWVKNGRKATKPVPGRPGIQRPKPCHFIASDDLAAWLMGKDDSGFSDVRDIGAVKLRVARHHDEAIGPGAASA
jgi:hypothetical protein